MIISRTDKERLVNAIKLAESKTSGEVRVHIQKKISGDVFELAQKKFNKLKMSATKHRNGVLVYIAFKNKQFAVVGDEGIHEKVGEVFWNQIIDKMKEHFKNDKFVDGLETGIEIIGDALQKHFPHEKDDINELSDEITIE